MTDNIDGAERYAQTAIDNERRRQLVAAEGAYQAAVATAQAAFVPGSDPTAFAASITSATSAKATLVAAAHSVVSAASSARGKTNRGGSR